MYEKKSINRVRFQKKRTLENLFDYAINNDSTRRLPIRTQLAKNSSMSRSPQLKPSTGVFLKYPSWVQTY